MVLKCHKDLSLTGALQSRKSAILPIMPNTPYGRDIGRCCASGVGVNISKTPDKTYYRTDETITVSVDNTLTETHRLAGWTLVHATRESGSAVSADDGELTNSITVKVTGNATVTAVFEPLLPPINVASKGNIIYFVGEGDNTFLSLGTWGNEITAENLKTNMASFIYGSVVGLDCVSSHTVLSSDISAANNAVRFNPQTSAFSAWSGIGFSDNGINVPSVNTLARVKSGLGDPCALLGITAAQIKAMTTEQEFTDALAARPDSYKNWRLPTDAETYAFVGSRTGWNVWTAHGNGITALSGNGDESNPWVVTWLKSGNVQTPIGGLRLKSGVDVRYNIFYISTAANAWGYANGGTDGGLGWVWHSGGSGDCGLTARCVR